MYKSCDARRMYSPGISDNVKRPCMSVFRERGCRTERDDARATDGPAGVILDDAEDVRAADRGASRDGCARAG
jgi:hypothetical protein